MATLNLTLKQKIAFHTGLQQDNEEIYAALYKTGIQHKRLLELYQQLVDEHSTQASSLKSLYDDRD